MGEWEESLHSCRLKQIDTDEQIGVKQLDGRKAGEDGMRDEYQVGRRTGGLTAGLAGGPVEG